MTARTLDDAIRMVNSIDYGLTSGLHSLDSEEIATWLDRVEGGNLYVNRGTTGAIVQRQPFGGWKKSAVGAGSKAGGPNYLFGLGSWENATARASGDAPTEPRVRRLLDALPQFDTVTASDRTWLARAAALDEHTFTTEFGIAKDVSGVGVERNVFRYRPMPVGIRFADGANPAEFLRVILAGLRSGSEMWAVSVSGWLETKISRELEALGLPVRYQTRHEWQTWLRRDDADDLSGTRIRLVGGSLSGFTLATGGRPDIALWSGPAVTAGRIEMLPFLREQAISITAHRFGTPSNLTDDINLNWT